MDMEKVLLLAEMATDTSYLDSSRTQVAESKDFRLELDLRFGSWVLRTIFYPCKYSEIKTNDTQGETAVTKSLKASGVSQFNVPFKF